MLCFSESFFSYLEEISDDKEFNANDIKRFNENDDYVLMIIQHGQTTKTFDEPKALRCFHDAMIWRKQHNIYGKFCFHIH